MYTIITQCIIRVWLILLLVYVSGDMEKDDHVMDSCGEQRTSSIAMCPQLCAVSTGCAHTAYREIVICHDCNTILVLSDGAGSHF